jgi:hypothetical protein
MNNDYGWPNFQPRVAPRAPTVDYLRALYTFRSEDQKKRDARMKVAPKHVDRDDDVHILSEAELRHKQFPSSSSRPHVSRRKAAAAAAAVPVPPVRAASSVNSQLRDYSDEIMIIRREPVREEKEKEEKIPEVPVVIPAKAKAVKARKAPARAVAPVSFSLQPDSDSDADEKKKPKTREKKQKDAAVVDDEESETKLRLDGKKLSEVRVDAQSLAPLCDFFDLNRDGYRIDESIPVIKNKAGIGGKKSEIYFLVTLRATTANHTTLQRYYVLRYLHMSKDIEEKQKLKSGMKYWEIRHIYKHKAKKAIDAFMLTKKWKLPGELSERDKIDLMTDAQIREETNAFRVVWKKFFSALGFMDSEIERVSKTTKFLGLCTNAYDDAQHDKKYQTAAIKALKEQLEKSIPFVKQYYTVKDIEDAEYRYETRKDQLARRKQIKEAEDKRYPITPPLPCAPIKYGKLSIVEQMKLVEKESRTLKQHSDSVKQAERQTKKKIVALFLEVNEQYSQSKGGNGVHIFDKKHSVPGSGKSLVEFQEVDNFSNAWSDGSFLHLSKQYSPIPDGVCAPAQMGVSILGKIREKFRDILKTKQFWCQKMDGNRAVWDGFTGRLYSKHAFNNKASFWIEPPYKWAQHLPKNVVLDGELVLQPSTDERVYEFDTDLGGATSIWVGRFYRNFQNFTDEEVKDSLKFVKQYCTMRMNKSRWMAYQSRRAMYYNDSKWGNEKGKGHYVFYYFDAVSEAVRKQKIEIRLEIMHALLKKTENIYCRPVEYYEFVGGNNKLNIESEILKIKAHLLRKGAEGIILKQSGSIYDFDKSNIWHKVKFLHDMYALVTGVYYNDDDATVRWTKYNVIFNLYGKTIEAPIQFYKADVHTILSYRINRGMKTIVTLQFLKYTAYDSLRDAVITAIADPIKENYFQEKTEQEIKEENATIENSWKIYMEHQDATQKETGVLGKELEYNFGGKVIDCNPEVDEDEEKDSSRAAASSSANLGSSLDDEFMEKLKRTLNL